MPKLNKLWSPCSPSHTFCSGCPWYPIDLATNSEFNVLLTIGGVFLVCISCAFSNSFLYICLFFSSFSVGCETKRINHTSLFMFKFRRRKKFQNTSSAESQNTRQSTKHMCIPRRRPANLPYISETAAKILSLKWMRSFYTKLYFKRTQNIFPLEAFTFRRSDVFLSEFSEWKFAEEKKTKMADWNCL